MTRVRIEPSQILVNFLRSTLSDINSSRVGNWIFSDFPRIKDLGVKSFPRIGITTLSETGDPMGIFDDEVFDTVTFQIDIITKKQAVYNITTTDEALGTMSSSVNSNRMAYEYLPNTVTNIKHTTTAFSTVTLVTNDAAFTTPASLAAGTVQVSKSTGNLNFSAADVTSYDAEAIISTSVITLEGRKACAYLAREIVKAIKNNWRTDTTIEGLLYPIKLSNVPMPFEEDLGIFRQTLEYQFRVFNAGEGL